MGPRRPRRHTASAATFANQRRYYEWIRGESTFDLIEATFDWLDDHWPETKASRF